MRTACTARLLLLQLLLLLHGTAAGWYCVCLTYRADATTSLLLLLLLLTVCACIIGAALPYCLCVWYCCWCCWYSAHGLGLFGPGQGNLRMTAVLAAA
jgi:hypothetical protein